MTELATPEDLATLLAAPTAVLLFSPAWSSPAIHARSIFRDLELHFSSEAEEGRIVFFILVEDDPARACPDVREWVQRVAGHGTELHPIALSGAGAVAWFVRGEACGHVANASAAGLKELIVTSRSFLGDAV